jgi:formylglycine-generating enzyme required for sulfatase activity
MARVPPTPTLTWATGGPAGPVAFAGDRYEDLGLLAVGGMGEVRRVRDRLLDCVVAMKVLSPDRVGSPAARARFVSEATVTARLRHPGIVAVHDRGERADGALWYTMTEVRGDTLTARIGAHHEAPSLEGLRRLVSVLGRVCEAVAFAHAEGVIHRDLKPDNVMVGPFGEILVVDWGVAGRAADPDAGLVGTPGWVAPEQARGEPPAPPADVYGLGGLLHAVLAGTPPRSGPSAELWWRVIEDPPRVAPPGPPALVAACAAAMEPDPALRPGAAALGERLVRWVIDAERTAEAAALLARAAEDREGLEVTRARVAELRARARTHLAGLSTYADADAKAPAWAWQDEAEELDRELVVRETAWLQRVGAALERDPELLEAHEVLADHYAAALRLAEAESRERDALRAEGFLRLHDRGRHAALLRGDGLVTLVTEPPGAAVTAFRLVERGRRLVPEEGVIGAATTPVHAVRVPRGSWLFELRHPAREVVRVPVALGRGEDATGVPPGAREPHAHRLPRPGELGPDDVLVPAGWCRIGGDPDAIEPLAAQRVWVDGFVMRRFPVTVAELRAFLADTRPERGEQSAAADQPATQVDWHEATAFAAWEAARTGLPWRLPDEVEWEKAARGADGRRFVTGNHFEAVWFNVLGGGASERRLAPVDTHPLDESVYGVRGLAGNAADWCANGWRDGPAADEHGRLLPAPTGGPFRGIRGGAYSLVNARAAQRHADPPERRLSHLGFRLVRSWPDAPTVGPHSA